MRRRTTGQIFSKVFTAALLGALSLAPLTLQSALGQYGAASNGEIPGFANSRNTAVVNLVAAVPTASNAPAAQNASGGFQNYSLPATPPTIVPTAPPAALPSAVPTAVPESEILTPTEPVQAEKSINTPQPPTLYATVPSGSLLRNPNVGNLPAFAPAASPAAVPAAVPAASPAKQPQVPDFSRPAHLFPKNFDTLVTLSDSATDRVTENTPITTLSPLPSPEPILETTAEPTAETSAEPTVKPTTEPTFSLATAQPALSPIPELLEQPILQVTQQPIQPPRAVTPPAVSEQPTAFAHSRTEQSPPPQSLPEQPAIQVAQQPVPQPTQQQSVPAQQPVPQQSVPAQQPAQQQPAPQPQVQPGTGILSPPEGFLLSPEESALLDQFLLKWERFGKDIKKVSCEVHVKEHDGGLYMPNRKTPLSHTWGKFRFIAPNKLSYHVEGEFVYKQGASSGDDPKPEYEKGRNELKFVCDGKSWTEYDFRKRVATTYPIPEDQWNQDLTMDGPFPLFFIANAENLKNRFYLRLVTPKERLANEVWIEAWPRQAADAGSFQKILVALRLSDLQPYYLRKYHVNGKSYSDLSFQNIAVNKGFWSIDANVDFGWKKEVKNEQFAITPASPPAAPPTQGALPDPQSGPLPDERKP